MTRRPGHETSLEARLMSQIVTRGSQRDVSSISRRNFLTAMGAFSAGVAATVGGRRMLDALLPEDAHSKEEVKKTEHKPMVEENVDELPLSISEAARLELFSLYPGLHRQFYRIALHPDMGGVATEEQLVSQYLISASFAEMKKDGVIRVGDELHSDDYLSPEKMWQKKCTDPRLGLVQKHACEQIRRNIIDARKEKREVYTLEQVEDLWRRNIDIVKAAIHHDHKLEKQFASRSPFARFITPAYGLALSVQELMPRDYHDAARLLIFKALLESGYEPHTVPSSYDGAVSFGVVQMVDKTYAEIATIDGIVQNPYLSLPKEFTACVRLEQQIQAATLLSLLNCQRYLYKPLAGGHPKFLQFLEKEMVSSIHDVEQFVAAVLAASHNHPASAKTALSIVANQYSHGNIYSTSQARKTFLHHVEIVQNQQPIDSYARRTSDLLPHMQKYWRET